MNFHIAMGRAIDLAEIDRDAQAGKCPRHVMWQLRERLGATLRQPGNHSVSSLDRMRSKVAGGPEHWALARALKSRLGSGDLVYCTGEDVGIPVAALCGAKPTPPKVVVFFHNIDRPRGRLALRLFQLRDRISLFVACSSHQIGFLRRYLHVPESRLYFLADQTDTRFFTPGPSSPNKARPVIASVGLEKRDYRTLAAATADLDADVRISGFSRDAVAMSKAFPEEMPPNMTRRFYEWPELVQLYRDADVVVISLVENSYAAGVQVLLEAMACQRAVVVTATTGLGHYMAPDKVVAAIRPGDAIGLREGILRALRNVDAARATAQRAYTHALNFHNSEQYVDRLAERLASIQNI